MHRKAANHRAISSQTAPINDRRSNLTLIGMPGAGKSTIGIILAKVLTLGFIDTDVLIQINRQQSLQEIIDDRGHLHLRRVEEAEVLKINLSRTVIATGGSVVYSENAMEHLRKISRIVFLKVDYDQLLARIGDFEKRGIAKSKNQTFQDLYEERQPLYSRYAETIFVCGKLGQEEIAKQIARKFRLQGRLRPE